MSLCDSLGLHKPSSFVHKYLLVGLLPFRKLVYIIKPCGDDYRGTISLSGTFRRRCWTPQLLEGIFSSTSTTQRSQIRRTMILARIGLLYYYSISKNNLQVDASRCHCAMLWRSWKVSPAAIFMISCRWNCRRTTIADTSKISGQQKEI